MLELQLPLAHCALVWHAPPFGICRMQVPPEHELFASRHAVPDGQQACPIAPQAVHVLVLVWQVDVELHLVVPEQQGCPALPHRAHVLALHTVPVLQLLPAQHDSPLAPQWVHLLALHE